MGRLVLVLSVLLVATPSPALNPGTDVLVPAAARVGSWVTDLYVLNPGAISAQVSVSWLVRGQANPDPETTVFSLTPGETLVLEDVILTVFSLETGTGAFRVVATGAVVVSARIYSLGEEGSFGQGFEGVPAVLATAAGQSGSVVGLAANPYFRTNLYALGGAAGATFTVSLRDTSGVELVSRTYALGAYQPMLGNILTELGSPQFDQATLQIAVSAGSAVVGASRIDSASQDPMTLESSWPCGGGGEQLPAGVYYGSVTLTGRERGVRLTLNGEGRVVELRFQMVSAQAGCNYVFDGGDQFEEPLPITAFLTADGVRFTNTYLTGQIEWTVRLVEGVPFLHYSGSLSGLASGSPGSPACDGDTGAGEIELGKQPL